MPPGLPAIAGRGVPSTENIAIGPPDVATATEIATAGRDSLLSRARVDGSTIEHAVTTPIPSAANIVGIDDDGTVRTVTRTGVGVRWSGNAAPAIEIDHGLAMAARVPKSARWLEAFDDGTYVLTDTQPRTFAELQRAVAAATTYHLIGSGRDRTREADPDRR